MTSSLSEYVSFTPLVHSLRLSSKLVSPLSLKSFPDLSVRVSCHLVTLNEYTRFVFLSAGRPRTTIGNGDTVDDEVQGIMLCEEDRTGSEGGRGP